MIKQVMIFRGDVTLRRLEDAAGKARFVYSPSEDLACDILTCAGFLGRTKVAQVWPYGVNKALLDMLKRFCEIHRYDEGLPHKPCQGQDFVCLYDEVTIGSYQFFDLRKARF